MKAGLRVIAGLVGYYAVLLLLAFCVSALAGGGTTHTGFQPQLAPERQWGFILGFVVVFAPVLYGIVHLARTRPDRSVRPSTTSIAGMFRAAGLTFLCAAPLEILVDSAFFRVTGQPCWEYRVWPIHMGFTSGVGAVMWPMYGAFVYAFHGALRARDEFPALHGWVGRAALIAVEAMTLEIAANAYALIGFHTFYFYYWPGDLLHYTTMAILVPYFVCGLVGVAALDCVERLPWPVAVGVGSWIAGVILMFGLA